MGVLFELTAYQTDDPGATVTAMTPLTGDSLTVRNFVPPSTAYIQSFDRFSATAAGVFDVRSPRLHDNVRGIHVASPEAGAAFTIPAYNNQQLFAQDTLIIEDTGGTAYDVVGLGIYYTNLPGSGARQHAWGDFSGQIAYLDTIEVAVESTAGPAAWTDTVITTTDNLLKANTDYAILGYSVDTAIAFVAVKGADTSNFRIGGPGIVDAYKTSDYFVRHSNLTGRPCIPVINAANKSNTYVSVAAATDAITTNVTLYLACLSQNLSS
jgi:hypothetical protein